MYENKAIFIVGGVGSGKSTVKNYILDKLGLNGVFYTKNADDYLEELVKEHKIDPKKDPARYEELRLKGISKAVIETDKTMRQKKPLIFDAVSTAPNILTNGDKLWDLGYSLMCLFVGSSLENSSSRNKNRERVVPEHVVKNLHERAQGYKNVLEREFGNNFVYINNNLPLTDNPSLNTAIDKVAKFLKNDRKASMSVNYKVIKFKS